MDINLKDMLPGLFQGKTKKRKVKVPEALEYLTQEEEQKLIDMDSVARTAVERVQQAGIIFIDEIDKIAGREGGHGPDVSREGVQRDILPIVEGTTVNTKYGMVRTDHILFIAAGAFHVSKPSDLIPELQGRFPIRVELHPLGKDEFVRILTEPRSALIKQYTALMETEGIDLTFTEDAIHRIAELATIVNDRTENIGARRLHTVMEKLLDEISFEGPDLVEQARHHRRGLRDEDAGRDRQERRPVTVHSVRRAAPIVVRAALAALIPLVAWSPAERRALRSRRSSGCPPLRMCRRTGADRASSSRSSCLAPTPTVRVRRISRAWKSTRSPDHRHSPTRTCSSTARGWPASP